MSSLLSTHTAKFIFFLLFTIQFVTVAAMSTTPFASELNRSAYSLLQKGQYEQAFAIAQQSLKRAREEHDLIEEARALSNLGANLFYLGDLDRALSFYLKSLDIATRVDNVEGELRAINNIASIYSDLRNSKEELAYRIKHLKISLRIDDADEILVSYIGLTSAYANNDQLSEAKKFSNLSKQLFELNVNPFYKVYALFAQNEIYKAEEKFDLALQNSQLILKIAQLNNYEGIEVEAISQIAFNYDRLGEFDRSIETALRTIKLAKKLNFKNLQVQAHQLLSEIFSKLRKFKKALYHNKIFYTLKSEIVNKKVKILAELTGIERDIAKTEKKLIQSQKDKEILTLKLEKQRQNQYIWIISLLSTFFITLFWYFRRASKKELERQKQLNNQLKELDTIKDRVLTNTSHELRTPLNGIIGLSNIIIHDDTNNFTKSTMQSLKLIKRSGEQLALVINDILQLSKLNSNKVTLTNTKFDLVCLINDVIKVCLPSSIDKHLKIKFDYKNRYIEIRQDRARLQQILFNIIGNAIKFTRQGEVELTVNKEDQEFSVCVKDTGIGIPRDRTERIFEGFEQVDNSDSREHQGTGLGLAISKKLVETMGGKLVLTSELGEGTQVEINLPC